MGPRLGTSNPEVKASADDSIVEHAAVMLHKMPRDHPNSLKFAQHLWLKSFTSMPCLYLSFAELRPEMWSTWQTALNGPILGQQNNTQRA